MSHQESDQASEPLGADSVDLELLIRAITPENLHPEVGFGDPTGHEIW